MTTSIQELLPIARRRGWWSMGSYVGLYHVESRSVPCVIQNARKDSSAFSAMGSLVVLEHRRASENSLQPDCRHQYLHVDNQVVHRNYHGRIHMGFVLEIRRFGMAIHGLSHNENKAESL